MIFIQLFCHIIKGPVIYYGRGAEEFFQNFDSILRPTSGAFGSRFHTPTPSGFKNFQCQTPTPSKIFDPPRNFLWPHPQNFTKKTGMIERVFIKNAFLTSNCRNVKLKCFERSKLRLCVKTEKSSIKNTPIVLGGSLKLGLCQKRGLNENRNCQEAIIKIWKESKYSTALT